MSHAFKFIEKCHIICDVAEGICCRLYNAKLKFISPDLCPPCLSHPEYLKIKARLEKTFPDIAGDLSKTQGYETFRQNCHHICGDLTFFNDIIVDICEFRRMAKELLADIPMSIIHYKLERNRAIITLFFDLMTWYMRVFIMLASIEDRKGIEVLYAASHFIAREMNDPNIGESVKLLVDSENIQRLFIDEFLPHVEFIGPAILLFYDSLTVHDNCENLRAKYVLNPTSDGDAMGLPARMMLNSKAGCELSMYTELRESSTKYQEYVMYSFLACPGLLFHAEGKYNDLFKLVFSDHLALNVFRDTVLNIHAELENLYTNFPSKKDNVPIPKNLKIKNVLKELAKVAVQTIGVRHQERRSFVHAELKNLKHILAAVPGLVGPKFPIVLAAAAMAKSEILHYFRHLNADTRKDVKKYQNNDHYKCRDISVLIQDLYEVTCFVEKYREVVQMYYAEYLTAIDAPELQPIIDEVSAALPDNVHEMLPRLLSSFCQDLSDIDLEQVSEADFEGVRINWERYSTLLGITGQFNKESNDVFCRKMMSLVERSTYVDAIPSLFKSYFMPYELWWFQPKLVEAFKESLEYNQQSFFVFGLLSVVPMNIHADCPEEGALLGDSAFRFCDYMVNTMNKYVDTLLKWLWDYFYQLEKKTRAADAGSRLEKQINARKEQKAVTPENYPGYESEGWAKKGLAALTHNKRGVLGILEAAHLLGPIMIFHREYNVEVAVRQNIGAYFETRIRNKVIAKGEMERPSIVLAEIAVGCKVVQTCFDFINADMPKILRHVLFRNFCDTSVLPPGAPPVLRQAPPDAEGGDRGVIWKIAQWFCQLVNQAAAAESGLMWIPSTSSFARAKTSLRPIDVYINREEMAALCAFIGVQGVRCIDSMLLSIVAEKVHTVRDFISHNQTTLIEFNRHRHMCGILSQLRMTESFLAASVVVGVTLALRETIHRGLQDSLKSFSPFINSSLTAVTSSLKPWVHQNVTSPVYALAYDAGVLGEVDLSLAMAIRPIIQSSEDRKLFTLLPVAYAASFMSSYWTNNGNYMPAFEAFKGNQHTLALTISKFFLCFVETVSGVAEGRPASMPRRKKSAVDGNSTYSIALREAADTFLELSSNVILAMRISEQEYADRQIRPISNILELFIRHFPLLDRHALEKYFPYAHIHSSQMDIAMGKIKASDSLVRGMSNALTQGASFAAAPAGDGL